MVVLSEKEVWVGCVIRCYGCKTLFVLESGDDVKFVSPNVTNRLATEYFVVNCPKCGRKRAFFPKPEKETAAA
ncbi:MAG: hypothetical protein A2655_00130 [Candidatus Yanofskybacteria bacterium RIFCSPHIGHO2_01_FULL_43_42]|uniref:Uncharacterized protein n=1 Tax=Candidatus Yanofskybacteria bacterium RIFCSPLOWO2_01_FULL_43_22 TaxID=1802695 RepID=A0A1F8GEF9_9BACT|nr:MAG: hypothetical protein A2655_00130 [Candidatus Yanofskybacteria bacterium RIFCSPHIGHO2_01_FULL_43_42]OGN12556.1 MAG: hypothetical protein A3D48_04465 [Candidatus Yanofskybacteria bacterium RIFCSPHIGHO2_02_FULL_43_17]OGN23703.1 MAG: hypothetical protein A3A13_00125 [Candidatus Yanofskybacteria bacterium RIFCSPLOWO2_01_FULL_43_22]